jgi:hypothetical protein
MKMTIQEMIDQLEEIKNELIVGDNGELTDYTRKWTYIHVDQAIERLQENREECKNAEDKS